VAKVRQPYNERRYVPWLGREVDPGQVVDVPDKDLAAYLAAGWTQDEPARKSATEKKKEN